MQHDGAVHTDNERVAPRDRLTWILFAVAGSFAYLLNGIGSILAAIQDELGISRSQVALLPSLFAVGLVIVGLVGGAAVRRTGRQTAFRAAMVGVAAGALLVCWPSWPVALLGAALLGCSCAVLIQLTPVVIGVLHPRRTTALVAEQNAVSSYSSAAAPLAVGAALALGVGWRVGYAWPVVLLLLLLPLVRGVPDPPAGRIALPRHDRGRSFDRPFWSRWLDILLAVSAEFCVLFWVTSAFATWYGLKTDMAVLWGSTFILGMAFARSLGTPITRRVPDRSMIVGLGCALALCGFVLFWCGGPLPIAAADPWCSGWASPCSTR